MLILSIFLEILILLGPIFAMADGTQDLEYPLDGTCYGGGMNFISPNYPLIHLFAEYKKKEKEECRVLENSKTIGDTYNQNKANLDNLIKKSIEVIQANANGTFQTCRDVKKMLEEFLVIRDKIDAYIINFQNNLKQNVQGDTGGLNLQQEGNHLAWISAYCANGLLGLRNKAYWNLVQRLIQHQSFERGTDMTGNNEVILDECPHGPIVGSGLLTNIDLGIGIDYTQNGEILFKYYSSKIFRFQVLMQSKVIFESRCQAHGKSSVTLPVPARTMAVFTVRMQTNCTRPNIDAASQWSVDFACGHKAPGFDPCNDLISELIVSGKTSLNSSLPIFDHYWMQVLCYEKVYTTVYQTLKTADFYTKILQGGQESPDIAINVATIPTTVPEIIPEITRPNFKITAESPDTTFVMEISNAIFTENIDFYCALRPGDKESIFKRITWAYCYYGFKRLSLFPEDVGNKH